MNEKAILDDIVIVLIVRWGKNGRKYVWENPTQKQMEKLISKYGIDQICDNTLWLEE